MLKADKRNPKATKEISKSLKAILLIFSTTLFLTSIISWDFLSFITNGGYQFFDNSGMFNQDFLIVLGIIVGVSFFFAFFLSFSRFISSVFTAAVLAGVVYSFLNKFSNINPQEILGVLVHANDTFNTFSHIIIPVGISFILLAFLETASIKKKTYTSLTFFIITILAFGHIFLSKPKSQQFVEKYNYTKQEPQKEVAQTPEAEAETEATPTEPNKKFVYLSFANLPSYNLIKDFDNQDNDTILGFFAKNGFSLYPNAYLQSNEKSQNLASILNFNKNSSQSYIQNNVIMKNYFNFDKTKDEYTFLKQSTLYNIFKKAGYSITAYQSNEINLCKINNRDTADTCIDQNISNTDISAPSLTTTDKVYLLLSQWLNSTGANKNFAMLNNHKYKNIQSINSLKQLDMLFEDIKNNPTQSLYIADINLPSRLYVFDKHCQLKARKNWISADDAKISKEAKRTAFVDQTQCLFAKLQHLIDQTNNPNIVYVISSNTGLLEETNPKTFEKLLKAEKLITFAILDPLNKTFAIDYNICPANQFLSGYLIKKNPCDIKDLDLNIISQKDIEAELQTPFDNRVENSITMFDTFFNEYKKANNIE